MVIILIISNTYRLTIIKHFQTHYFICILSPLMRWVGPIFYPSFMIEGADTQKVEFPSLGYPGFNSPEWDTAHCNDVCRGLSHFVSDTTYEEMYEFCFTEVLVFALKTFYCIYFFQTDLTEVSLLTVISPNNRLISTHDSGCLLNCSVSKWDKYKIFLHYWLHALLIFNHED